MPRRYAAPELLHTLAETVVAVVDLVGTLKRLGAAIGRVVDLVMGAAGARFSDSVLPVRYTRNRAYSYFIG